MTEAGSQTKAKAIRILHVDDDSALLQVSKLILKTLDNCFEVDFALGVDEAFHMLTVNDFDVIVSDYEMPQKDGLEFLKELREKKNQIPFILFTGKGREEVAIKALNLGANGYYNKQGSTETVYGELIHGIKAAVAHKKAELALLESQDRFQEAQAIAHVGNWEIDLHSMKIWASEEAFRIYGIEQTNDNVLSLDFAQQVVLPEYRPEMDHTLQELISGNKEYNVEYKIKRKNDNKERYIHSKAELVHNQEKTPIKVVGVIQDITELRTAQETSQKSTQQYYQLFSTMTELFQIFELIYDTNNKVTDYRIVDVNPSFERFAGKPKEELVGKSVKKDLWPVEDYWLEIFNQVLKTGNPAHFESYRSAFNRYYSLYIYRFNEKQLASIATDITERKKAQDTIEHAYRILEKAGEGMDAGLAVIDRDYNVVWANKILKSAGVCADKKCYQTFTKLNRVCPDCGVKKVLEENVDLDVHEYGFIDSKGEKAWVELRVSPIRDKDGNVTSAIELAVPITERKKIEEQLIADQSKLEIVNEKLQVVGSLTRHDVANKLSTANSNAYLLKKKLKDQPELLPFVEAIELAIKQSSKLFEFSHLYEKIGAEEPTKIDVAASLEQAIALVPNFGVELVNKTSGLKVLADSMLRQLFYAFIDNSLKHGKNVTKITVSYIEINDEIRLIYEDNGVGIPEESKDKIFSSGFTTGGGSGRGLKLVSRLAKAYGWSIKENGILGKGAKFEITIPHKKT